MSEVRTIESKKEGRRPRPLLVPALVAAVIAMVAVLMYLNRQVFVADQDTPAEAVALAYVDALARNDVEMLHELVAPDSDVDWSDQSLVHEWQRAAGIVITQLDCTELSSGPGGTLVDCPWIYGSDWHRALGLEPSSMRNVLLVKEGKIQGQFPHVSEDEDDVARVWNTFSSWVELNHPADVPMMYDDVNGGAYFSPESIALWEQYTDEFVAEMESSR